MIINIDSLIACSAAAFEKAFTFVFNLKIEINKMYELGENVR